MYGLVRVTEIWFFIPTTIWKERERRKKLDVEAEKAREEGESSFSGCGGLYISNVYGSMDWLETSLSTAVTDLACREVNSSNCISSHHSPLDFLVTSLVLAVCVIRPLLVEVHPNPSRSRFCLDHHSLAGFFLFLQTEHYKAIDWRLNTWSRLLPFFFAGFFLHFFSWIFFFLNCLSGLFK